jgi:hypothetical protein
MAETLLAIEGKIGLSVLVAVLVGLITMLAERAGLFLTGFCAGGLLGIGGILIAHYFTTLPGVWVSVIATIVPGLLAATITLRWTRVLCIFATALLGSALIVSSLDYFVENWHTIYWVRDRLLLTNINAICWWSVVMLIFWPTLAIVGALAQHKMTVVVQSRPIAKVKYSPAPTQQPTPKRVVPEMYTPPNTNYLHLYQVRRVNGDVISQVRY